MLTSPFPYYGAKSRWASDIWERFGRPDVYAEPFAGSLAVLLRCPHPARREVVCDLDGMIANFWRALQADPEAVARHADYPTIHQDLTARHRWLVRWAAEHSERLSADPRYFDAEAAGWWVWGISLWIGGGWCADASVKRPRVNDDLGGRGVSKQREKRPIAKPAGVGVSKQRKQIPNVHRDLGGTGITRQGKVRRCELIPWFEDLAQRLSRAVVLNRDWSSAVTRTVLAYDRPCGRNSKLNRCILLDPPYRMERRKATLYASDMDGTSEQAAVDSFRWAVEHGDEYRIAYCAHEGDFDVPDGWDALTRALPVHGQNSDRARDMVMFSPACVRVGKQARLFG